MTHPVSAYLDTLKRHLSDMISLAGQEPHAIGGSDSSSYQMRVSLWWGSCMAELCAGNVRFFHAGGIVPREAFQILALQTDPRLVPQVHDMSGFFQEVGTAIPPKRWHMSGHTWVWAWVGPGDNRLYVSHNKDRDCPYRWYHNEEHIPAEAGRLILRGLLDAWAQQLPASTTEGVVELMGRSYMSDVYWNKLKGS